MNDKTYNAIVAVGGLITGYIMANTGRAKPTIAKSATYAALGAVGGLVLVNVIRKVRAR